MYIKCLEMVKMNERVRVAFPGIAKLCNLVIASRIRDQQKSEFENTIDEIVKEKHVGKIGFLGHFLK
ncbi:Oidioi.mRNA.OKI2018_I69.chr2.g7537.t1.cds [Oikopleura dioica]|uniref:Oidioi.mRNA.OKI2018_I69.chr2.g7537.t1.cds n=1 Tax=Oikopleura dioica TaxID=34765 RepID=A0ABN7TFE5_OIKDI|nr:Oidioi.mRNA.OKI2018_I69.chr2.g7537.t1.cds [Oikopleura dioica]